MTLEKFKCQLQSLLPHHGLSRLLAKLADSQVPFIKDRLITLFIKHYKVDLSIAQSGDLADYRSFNDFFVRALKPGARPIHEDLDTVVSPADGFISQAGQIRNDRLIQAKGSTFSFYDLMGRHQNVDHYLNGEFVTIYLSPKDYHRVHMPLTGKLMKTIYIPGKLFSVNFASAKYIPNLFCRNERLVCFFDTEVGEIAVILVGAMLVAGIETVWEGHTVPCKSKKVTVKDYGAKNIVLEKGDELGRFKFGSTVILLFRPNQVKLCTFKEQQPIKMGEFIGRVMDQKAAMNGSR